MEEILRADYTICAATNGERALALAQSDKPPDIILLDVIMPGMDGFEVCRRLKAESATRKLPIIFVTALGEIEDESQGFALGAVDYIHKPVSPPIVLARVQTHLALYDQKRTWKRWFSGERRNCQIRGLKSSGNWAVRQNSKTTKPGCMSSV